jgi:hypothetical protein
MVLSETRRRAGLTLLRVLRGGLWLCTCLGGLWPGGTRWSRLPLVPGPGTGEPRRGNETRAGDLETPGYVDCAVSFVGS